MAKILIPQQGLTLVEPSLSKPSDGATKSGNMPTQSMLLDLEDNVLQEILKVARHGGKGMSVNFGKTIVGLPIDNSFLLSCHLNY